MFVVDMKAAGERLTIRPIRTMMNHGATEAQPDLGDTAGRVLERVREGAVGADELARATDLAASEIAVALTELELAGAVREEDGVFRAAS